MPDYHANALNDVLGRLAGRPVLAAAIRHLGEHVAAINAELMRAVLAEVPQFSASMNPDIRPESARHAALHTPEILRLLRGGALGTFEFVRDHAHRRAEQRFPLEATLHAYRSGHKVLSRWLRESPLPAGLPAAQMQRDIAALTDFALEYTDAISTSFAASYSAHTLLLADLAGDQRAELLEVLLGGHDEADLRVARILREAGFPNRPQLFCVALARSVDPAEMQNAARARRLADAIENVLAASPVRRLIDVRANQVTMVFADVRRESGWTTPRQSLAKRMSAALDFVGNAALVGVSNDVPSTAHLVTAHREASAALELADVRQRVLQFAHIPLPRLVLHFAEEDFRRLRPAWANEFYAADAQAQGALGATLRAYAAADMNLLRAAHTLGLHPNTIYARFQRIYAISGLQARSFSDLSALLIIADCKREGATELRLAGAQA
jgi:hypothetical protein